MRYLLSLCCFGVLVLSLSAQETEKRLSLGLIHSFPKWNSFTVSHEGGNQTYHFTLNHRQQMGLYLQLEKARSDGWRRSWALLQADFRRSDDANTFTTIDSSLIEVVHGYKEHHFGLRLRWAYGKAINWLSSERLETSLSLAMDPYFQYHRQVPKTSAGFPFRLIHAGVVANFLPHLQYRLGKRLRLSLQAPLAFNRFYWYQSIIDKPILTYSERSVSGTMNRFGLKVEQLLLGVSYSL